MSENSVPNVPFTTEKITNCICPQCPVQGMSRCVKDKMENWSKIMKTGNSQDFPGVYCSTGISACQDIDAKQMCICGGCAVWQEYDLINGEPAYYFCKNAGLR